MIKEYGLEKARVISQNRGSYRIAIGHSEVMAEVSGKFEYEAKTAVDYPVVGDFVMVESINKGNSAIIHQVLERKSLFTRRAAGTGKEEQVIAANIDTVFICMSLNNDFNVRRLERYLAAVYDSGAMPVIVFTKSDLCEDIDEVINSLPVEISMGCSILSTSSLASDGFEGLTSYLEKGKTVAFVGSSGVGKSTLINKLIGRDEIATNGLRNDDKGRHTTTHRELITLESGAMVVDTPGMRELGMWDNEEGIDTVFSDIEELALGCKFSDCTHTNEPGCKVRAAISKGELSEERLSAYFKLKQENEYMADSKSYLESKNEKFKKIAQINKSNKSKHR